MFCVATVARVYVFIVTVLRIHVLSEWYVCMFCIVIVVHIHVL